jgi:dienelactone hydrolase
LHWKPAQMNAISTATLPSSARDSSPAPRTPAAQAAVRAAAGSSPQEVEATVRRYVLAWHLDQAARLFRWLRLKLVVLLALGALPAAAEVRLLGDAQGAIGLFSVPKASTAMPAVVLVHDSLGIDRRSEPTVRHLLQAGIAALEVELYAVSPDGADSALAFDPEAEAKLLARAQRALAAERGIDATRLAALGFGRGAHAVALMPMVGGQDWSARVLLYPACGALADALSPKPATSRAPVLVLHGDTGAGDPPRDCPSLASRFEDMGIAAGVIRYPGASHGWDVPMAGEHAGSFLPDPAGRGVLRVASWPGLAEMSAAQAVGFIATVPASR